MGFKLYEDVKAERNSPDRFDYIYKREGGGGGERERERERKRIISYLRKITIIIE